MPAGILDVGIGAGFLWEGEEEMPRAAGEGDKGVEKGCAAPVDVAVGGETVRGEEGVDVGGTERRRGVLVKVRDWVERWENGRRERQREQIIFGLRGSLRLGRRNRCCMQGR